MTYSPVSPDQIEARALAHVGVPFRFKGRSAAGFDCVGLVADAVGIDAPFDYRMRGDFAERIAGCLEAHGFERVDDELPGDILLVRAGPSQLHLMIATRTGFVHAHAGLCGVVLSPAPLPWPVLKRWRLKGI